MWPRNANRGDDGVVQIAGVPVTELAEKYGTPLFVVDEDDFRSRCRDMARGVRPDGTGALRVEGVPVRRDRALGRHEGLSLDVASGGELAVALHAGFPAERIAMHGNNKSVAELRSAVSAPVSGTSCSTR